MCKRNAIQSVHSVDKEQQIEVVTFIASDKNLATKSRTYDNIWRMICDDLDYSKLHSQVWMFSDVICQRKVWRWLERFLCVAIIGLLLRMPMC